MFFQAAAPPIQRAAAARATAAAQRRPHPVPLRRHALRPAGRRVAVMPRTSAHAPRPSAAAAPVPSARAAGPTPVTIVAAPASTGRSTDMSARPEAKTASAVAAAWHAPRACLRYRAAQARAIVLSVRLTRGAGSAVRGWSMTASRLRPGPRHCGCVALPGSTRRQAAA